MDRAGLLLASLLIAGCGASSATAPPVDATGKYVPQVAADFPSRSGYSAVTLHIEHDGSLRYQREQRIRDLTNRCLTARGHSTMGPLEYTQAQLSAEFVRPVLAQIGPAGGYSDEGSPAAAPGTTTSVAAGDAQARLECGRSAMTAAFVDYTRYEAARQALADQQAQFLKVFWESPPMVRLNGGWSACMKAAGIAVATPNDARDRALHSPDETRIAAADLRCRQTTEYGATFDRLFNSAEAQFIVGNRFVIGEVVPAGQLST